MSIEHEELYNYFDEDVFNKTAKSVKSLGYTMSQIMARYVRDTHKSLDQIQSQILVENWAVVYQTAVNFIESTAPIGGDEIPYRLNLVKIQAEQVHSIKKLNLNNSGRSYEENVERINQNLREAYEYLDKSVVFLTKLYSWPAAVPNKTKIVDMSERRATKSPVAVDVGDSEYNGDESAVSASVNSSWSPLEKEKSGNAPGHQGTKCRREVDGEEDDQSYNSEALCRPFKRQKIGGIDMNVLDWILGGEMKS
ncbi:hypothetical protein BT63DRAFT_417823 [Microthyrium microscopicum]|uniref:Uncharacterized protein n=1 Tax=Microthyrium microscopicum TaxID=703497 RepID=A0A6A6TXK9_9PEZI|nr:hypothetical protein BT63DRAFT_417823 [Microthyrium microscopicum]